MLKRTFRATSVTAIVFVALSMFTSVQAAEGRVPSLILRAVADGEIAPAQDKPTPTVSASTISETSTNSGKISVSAVDNTKVKIVDSAGNGVPGFFYAFSNASNVFAKGPTNSAGEYSGILQDAVYDTIAFIPNSSEIVAMVEKTGTVTNGILTINGATKEGDWWKITLPNSNLRVKIVHPVTSFALTQVSLEVYESDSNWTQNNWITGTAMNANGRGGVHLENGNYIGELYPYGSSSSLTRKLYRILVSDSGTTISDGSVQITPVDGFFPLSPGLPNVSGTYKTSSGPVVFSSGQSISIQLQKKDAYGSWIYQPTSSYSNTNTWGLSLSGEGQYKIIANPYNFNDLVRSEGPVIWVNSSNQFSLTQNGTYTDSLTAVEIEMKSPNLRLMVVNPLSNDEPVVGGYAELFKVNNSQESYVSYGSISPSNPGITGFNIAEAGNYVVKVTPPSGNLAIAGLASKKYQVNASSLDSITVSSGGTPVSVVNGRSVVRLATANVTARIFRPDGSLASAANNRWYYVHVQKLNLSNNWDWINLGMQVDQSGGVSFRVDTAGKYRLRIEPYNDSTASVTFSTEFTISAGQEDTFEKKFGDITLNQPTLRVSVAAPGTPDVLLKDAGISMMKDGQWYDWANTGSSGVAGISLSGAGNYVFDVHPTQALQGSNTKKSYKFTATLNSDGVVSASPVVADGASTANGIVKLLLGLPTLTGTVKDPSGLTNQINSQVYAQNIQTGQDMWEYSTQTNQNGVWSMLLPAGTYRIYANAPWGTSQFGKSSPVGNVVVDSSGVATSVPAGYSANNFVMKLKNPTWSGTVLAPTDSSTIPNARVCLLLNNVWNCATADMEGKWALSMSDSFTSFDGTNPLLDIYDDYLRAYPFRRVQGAAAVAELLGPVGSTGRYLRMQGANVRIQVTAPGSTKSVSNLWTVADRDNVGFLGGGSTDANGIVKLYIADLTQPFKIRVEVNGNPEISQEYASVMKTISLESITAGTSGGIFSTTIELPTPNFKFVVREPTDVGSVIPYTWVELFSGNDGPWLGGSSTDKDGFASFKLDGPSSGTTRNYTVTVNPSWNATSIYTRQSYNVSVASNGSITSVINKTDQTCRTLSNVNGKDVYPLELGTPSVTGVVVDPSNNTVANSWVVPINAATNEYYWQQGVNSRQDGQLAMNLAAGSYKLEANVPWGSTDIAKSAKCSVTVAGGTISTGGDCVQGTTSKTVRLQLREPNVKFTLKVNGTVIPNANIGVGAGSWWTNVQSDSQGRVSLFIDAAAIREANTWANGSAIRLWFWIDPPYGSSTMARWSCGSTENKPLCKDLPDVPSSGDYVGRTNWWTVEGMQPNTRLKVVVPGTTTPLANSWVVVLAMNSSGNKWWLNGGNSGSDGYAAINVETATAFTYGYNKLVVEVNAPWNDRTKYATSEYTYNGLGYTFESLTALTSVEPAVPNLSIKIKDKNNYENRYGWFGVQEVDGSNNYFKWVGGYGLNDLGEGSVFLTAGKRFRVTFYPGGGRQGVESACIFTTDNATPVAVTKVSCEGTATLTAGVLELKLAGGNVGGTVLNESGTALVGAVVYAFEPGAASEASAVVTVTDSDGHYDLQLKAGSSWNIKVFPPSEQSNRLGVKTLSSPFTPSNSTVTTKNFNYATP